MLGLISSFPLYFFTFCPRKSKPSLIWVIFVFTCWICNPLSERNVATAGTTSSSRVDLSFAVTTKSSAYLIKLILSFSPILFLRRFMRLIPQVLSIARSNPSKVRLASTGDIIPPWGVPASVRKKSSFSIKPDFNYCFRITLSKGMLSKSHSWLMLSKQPLMSASNIHGAERFPLSTLKHCSMASAQHLSGRNP